MQKSEERRSSKTFLHKISGHFDVDGKLHRLNKAWKFPISEREFFFGHWGNELLSKAESDCVLYAEFYANCLLKGLEFEVFSFRLWAAVEASQSRSEKMFSNQFEPQQENFCNCTTSTSLNSELRNLQRKIYLRNIFPVSTGLSQFA